MDKRLEHLATLGLGPDASWEDVLQAYKDMMRVWHPDRFQADERLRKKAEKQAQRINNAMAELRKLGKDQFEKIQRQPKHTPHTNHDTSRHSSRQRQRHQQFQNRPNAHSSNAHQGPQSDFTRSSFSFEIAPLLVRAKASSSFTRILVGATLAYLAYDSFLRSAGRLHQEAFSVAILFIALDLASRSLLNLIVPGALIVVDKAGLVLPRTGRLNWIDFDSVWPLINPRFRSLSVSYSPHYINKHPPLVRTLLNIRRRFSSADLVVPFNGLTASPVDVVNAMKLFQLHEQMILQEAQPPKVFPFLVLQVIALAACVIPFVRCFYEGGLSQAEYLVYLCIFIACRLTEYVFRRTHNALK